MISLSWERKEAAAGEPWFYQIDSPKAGLRVMVAEWTVKGSHTGREEESRYDKYERWDEQMRARSPTMGDNHVEGLPTG